VKPRDDACLRDESLGEAGDEGHHGVTPVDPVDVDEEDHIGPAAPDAPREAKQIRPSPIPEDRVHRYPRMQEAPARCHDLDVQTSLDQPPAEGVGMVRFRRSHGREGGEEEDSHRTGHS
jgi:hypothetical protein